MSLEFCLQTFVRIDRGSSRRAWMFLSQARFPSCHRPIPRQSWMDGLAKDASVVKRASDDSATSLAIASFYSSFTFVLSGEGPHPQAQPAIAQSCSPLEPQTPVLIRHLTFHV